MHIENSVINCLEQLQQYQTEIMKNLKDVKDDKEKVKEYDKQLDACSHLIQSIIKFKRCL
jgi:chromosome segregation ATPase